MEQKVDDILSELAEIENEYSKYLIEKYYEQQDFLKEGDFMNEELKQRCKKCNSEKGLNEFVKDCKSRLGVKSTCKECQSAYKKEWALKNRNYVTAENRRFREQNREKLMAYKKNWVEENREKVNEYERVYKKNVRDTNKLFKIAGNVSSLIRGLISNSGYTEKPNIFKILGCDWETFKAHIESQFQPGMSWMNREDWHLDHIYPISSAITRREVFKLSNYKNFRPMWKKDNILKSDSFISEAGVLICELFNPNPHEDIIYQLNDIDSLVYHQEKILDELFSEN